MEQDLYSAILKILEKDIKINTNENLINTLFEKRSEKFHVAVTKNDKYKVQKENLKKANEKIFNKYENAWDIISELENWQNISDEISHIIELQMYKYGVYDGIKLILDSINK